MTPDALAALSKRAYVFMTPWPSEAFAQTLRAQTTLLVSHPNAFVIGRVILDEVEIFALATDPDAQRQGHAALALNDFHQKARQRGATQAFLEVAAQNTPARAFYTQHGYQQTGLRRRYYALPDGSRDDAILMSRDL